MQHSARAYAASFGVVIFALRTARGLSQEALAALVEAGQSTVSRVEDGQVLLNAYEVTRYASAFGLTPSDLLNRVEGLYARVQVTTTTSDH